MKAPYSKLPIRINPFIEEEINVDFKDLFEGSYPIISSDNKLVGQLEYAGDIDYFEGAINNFPAALEYLKEVLTIINIDGEECSDGECLDRIFALNIDEFLNKFEDGK